MPVKLQGIEYVTTQEAMRLMEIKSRMTWAKLVKQYGLQHTAQVGKSKRYLWPKSDVQALRAPIRRS